MRTTITHSTKANTAAINTQNAGATTTAPKQGEVSTLARSS